MGLESAKSFLEKVKTDAALADQVQRAKTAGEVVKKAAEMGYSFTQEDLQAASTQLSDVELQGVSGGEQTCKCGYYSEGAGGTGHTGCYPGCY